MVYVIIILYAWKWKALIILLELVQFYGPMAIFSALV